MFQKGAIRPANFYFISMLKFLILLKKYLTNLADLLVYNLDLNILNCILSELLTLFVKEM